MGSDFLLGLTDLLEVKDWLMLAPQDVLIDVAGGPGGYRLWLGTETGSRFIGVDFCPVTVELAHTHVRKSIP